MLRTIGAQIVLDEGNSTRPLVRVNEYLDMTKARIRMAQGSYIMMSDSFNQGMTSAGFFFAQADQSARENAIRQQYHNTVLQQAAIKYEQMRVAVTGYADTAKSKIQETNKYIEENRMQILGAGAALAGYGYLGGTFYQQGIKEMAEYQDAYATFSQNVKGDAHSLESALKKASGGQMDEGDILKGANRALLMGVSQDRLEKMMKASRAMARATGQDVTTVWDSFVSGAAKQSPRVLEQVGINMAGLTEAEKQWARSRGISSSALTEEQKNLIFMNYVLDRSDQLIKKVDSSQESLTETMKRSDTAWNDFRQKMAEGAAPAIKGMAGAAEWATGALANMPAPLAAIIGTGGLAATVFAGVGGALLINAAAVSVIAANYQYMVGDLRALLPLTVTQAYAQGGLTAALYAGATASWAFVAPWLPWIGIATAVLGAGWLMWDLFNNGWENSMLGKFVGWLNREVPILGDGIRAVVSAAETLWKWITTIPEAVQQSWRALNENPVFRLGMTLYQFGTPLGLTYTAADFGAKTAQAAFANTAPVTAPSMNTQTIRAGDVHYTSKTEIYTQKLDESQIDEISTRSAKKASRLVQDENYRQIRGVLG